MSTNRWTSTWPNHVLLSSTRLISLHPRRPHFRVKQFSKFMCSYIFSESWHLNRSELCICIFFSNGLTFCMLCFPCFASLRSTVPPHFSSCRPSSGFLHFRMCQPAHNNTCQMDAAEVGTKAFTTRITETWIKTYFLPRWKVKWS